MDLLQEKVGWSEKNWWNRLKSYCDWKKCWASFSICWEKFFLANWSEKCSYGYWSFLGCCNFFLYIFQCMSLILRKWSLVEFLCVEKPISFQVGSHCMRRKFCWERHKASVPVLKPSGRETLYHPLNAFGSHIIYFTCAAYHGHNCRVIGRGKATYPLSINDKVIWIILSHSLQLLQNLQNNRQQIAGKFHLAIREEFQVSCSEKGKLKIMTHCAVAIAISTVRVWRRLDWIRNGQFNFYGWNILEFKVDNWKPLKLCSTQFCLLNLSTSFFSIPQNFHHIHFFVSLVN